MIKNLQNQNVLFLNLGVVSHTPGLLSEKIGEKKGIVDIFKLCLDVYVARASLPTLAHV